jgi:hypothetical protein
MEALMNRASLMVLFAMSVGMAACSENTAAPITESQDSSTSVFGGGASQALTSYDTIKFSITIDPSRNTYYYLGDGNSLNFPAKSLCDVNKSSYGVSEWDQPCTVATSPVTVYVKAWMDKKGHARVDFDKHIRFVPSSNPANWVNLTFGDLEASLDPFFNILYCATTSGACVDESKTDVTLLTVRNPLTGRITRRIKHFSGYNVAAGREEDEVMPSSFSISPADRKLQSVDEVLGAHPNFTVKQAEDFLSAVRREGKSGYILASG